MPAGVVTFLCVSGPSAQVKSMDAEGALLLGHTRESAKNQPVLNLLRPQGGSHTPSAALVQRCARVTT